MKTNWKVTIFIWCCLGAIWALSPYKDLLKLHHTTSDEFSFAGDTVDMAELYALNALDSLEKLDKLASLDSLEKPGSLAGLVSAVDTINSSPSKGVGGAGLTAFHAALGSLCDSTGRPQRAIRVVHYGDSQIEEDRISMVIRRHLQDLYGGGGVGLIPLHQTIPTRTLSQQLVMNGEVQRPNGGPQRYMIYGPRSMRRDTALYGPMGQVAMMSDSLVAGSEDLLLHLGPTNYGYSVRPYTDIRLLADSGITMQRDSLGLHLRGQGAVYGLSLETKTGVMVDNIPMRGCLGLVFTEMETAPLRQYFRDTNTRLIILQYGGNFLPTAKSEDGIRSAVYGLRKQVRLMRELAPEASILFIGPSDMLQNQDGQMHTNPFVPLMDELLADMARREQIAYFSLYRMMGGEDSMLYWQDIGWAGSDGVHFTRKGAEHAGEMLWESLAPNP